LTVCRQAEAREKEGLIVFGIGINDKRVAKFYRNSQVLTAYEGPAKSRPGHRGAGHGLRSLTC